MGGNKHEEGRQNAAYSLLFLVCKKKAGNPETTRRRNQETKSEAERSKYAVERLNAMRQKFSAWQGEALTLSIAKEKIWN